MVHMVASTNVFVGSNATVSLARDLVPARKMFPGYVLVETMMIPAILVQ